MFHAPNYYRIRTGPMGSDDSYGNAGAFKMRSPKNVDLFMLASNDEGWEHVSVSIAHRCPTWFEMCLVKDLFWDAEDVVMQLHPAKSDYVNNFEYCLHLWRPDRQEIPLPPSILVGIVT